ncbi:hypothetical protein BCR32DRAFT_268124 [Anaeromyces robustus]|uniref:Uncharacterized protein n=1 Tax=Anaeromyces robustus TaxID=1754192 RepID=A0A1Y1X7K3_9FUNG|nr:hypothetical protein BCR32DRAFT_268124 [Anaeromyces robustus]|eukprot:ORX81750.1 hypothetical protein BCR32DRAFT_268124 [Anaeromyces robustus]
MNKFIKLLISLFWAQWVFVNSENVNENEYIDSNFKAQLDGSFKKYFNDNIYKIKEYSRERKFFNRDQDGLGTDTLDNTGVVQNLSCNGSFISSLKSCTPDSNNKFSCIKDLNIEEFNAYLSCINTDNTEVPNYGSLINAIVLQSIKTGSVEIDSLNNGILDVYTKIKFVASKNFVPYTTDNFFRVMEDFKDEESESTKIISSNYLDCLKLVDEEIYTVDNVSLCLCAYGYSSDNKLVALYSYYGFSESNFETVCKTIEAESNIYNDENQFISGLEQEKFETLLRGYNIPDYGALFNKMINNSLKTSNIYLKKLIYDLYNEISVLTKGEDFVANNESIEFDRCMVQATNQILGNKGFSYCLCNAGYAPFESMSELYNKYQIDEDTFKSVCTNVKKERDKDPYCRLGKSVQKCLNGIEENSTRSNYTECLDIGTSDGYLRQTKCLCDLYKAKWVNNDFLTCYGYTELSFTLGCRQFYPNQMFSDNPARGIENYNSENYNDVCGDVGTGGGSFVHDPCICKYRQKYEEVSLELDDICSRVGTKYRSCSAGFLTAKYSGILMLLTITMSIFFYI